MSGIIMRFSFAAIFLALPLLCWPQSTRIDVRIEPVLRDSEDTRKLDEDDDPMSPFDITQELNKLLSQESGNTVFVFFCTEKRRYKEEEYKAKLDEMKNSVVLNGGRGSITAKLIYFMNSSKSEGKGAMFSYQSNTEKIDEQSCYVFNANESFMSRLCEKYKRQFISRRVANGCFELELVDQDKCYQDIPYRITAYSRAVRELIDPDYSQEERNRMTEEKLNSLKSEIRNLETEMKGLIKSNSDTIESRRKAMYTELVNGDFAQRDYLLSGFRFNLSLNTERGGRTGPQNGKSAEIANNSAIGYAFRIGQRMKDHTWLELGWNAEIQTMVLVVDSAFTGETAADVFGTAYTRNSYLKAAKESITIRRNTIPLTFSYILPLQNSAFALEAFAGVGITLVSSVSSQFTEGTVDVRASYDGFASEIANIPTLGLLDGQVVSSEIRFHQVKNAFCQTIGVRGTYNLIGGTSLCGSFGYTNSSGLIAGNDRSGEYSLLNDLKIVKQNPLNISIGLSHCFKYEKK
jgi:hypothetical protein